jgi:hypothetical protein
MANKKNPYTGLVIRLEGTGSLVGLRREDNIKIVLK